jgi:hypothetical protein
MLLVLMRRQEVASSFVKTIFLNNKDSDKRKIEVPIEYKNVVVVDCKFDCLFDCLIALGRDLLGLCSLSESIFKATSHGLHVTHTSSACCATTLGLFSPIEISHFLGGISTRRASLLLNVKGDLATSTARCVRLVVSLSE